MFYGDNVKNINLTYSENGGLTEIYWECTVRKGRYKNKDVSKQMTEALNMPDLLMLENSTGGEAPAGNSRGRSLRSLCL